MSEKPLSAVSVRKVQGDNDYKAFFEFPWTVYKGDPNWVPPLLSIRKKLLDKTKNPSWEYLTGEYFIAWRGSTPVGTIAAFINHRHNEYWNEKIGWFGCFECFDDQEAATALLTTAAEWVHGQGSYTGIRGPAQFTHNDEWALLIENFTRPAILMPYNHPYYQRLIEDSGLGYAKAMDLNSWYSNPELLQGDGGFPPKLVRVVEHAKQKNNIVVRKADAKHLRDELKLLRSVYETAWEKNWSFLPPTAKEMDALFTDLKDYVDADLGRFATIDGKTVSFLLSLPDMNQVLQKAYPRPGEPEIWTLIKALWYWKVLRIINWQRLILFGVNPEARRMGVDAAIMLSFFQEAVQGRYPNCDAGWILETNQPMNQFAINFKGKLYKRYRIYQKPLN